MMRALKICLAYLKILAFKNNSCPACFKHLAWGYFSKLSKYEKWFKKGPSSIIFGTLIFFWYDRYAVETIDYRHFNLK